MKKTWIALCLGVIFASLSVEAKPLNTGPWRFELRTTHAAIPFIIDFKLHKNKLRGTLHNGKETIPLREIVIKDDKLSIPLQAYELSLELTRSDGALTGFLVRHNKNPVVKTPVVGFPGDKKRFPEGRVKPAIDLNGKWALELVDEKDEKTVGVGNFQQKGDDFSGSILTPTGDYRYLEGNISGFKFQAASFDGVYNYLFKGEVIDGKMKAEILSNLKTKVTGKKDPKAELPDAYKQTELQKLSFAFPDLKGQMVNLNHPKFKGKPLIVQIYGSWCPNCMDEMNYFIPWYKENAKRGIEIVALAFERSLGPAEATRQLLKVQKKYKVPYTILQAGSTSEDKPADKLPGLKNFISFPTTIFLNKNHEVVKVHAGFTGPSTGEFFEKWKGEFNQTVDELLK